MSFELKQQNFLATGAKATKETKRHKPEIPSAQRGCCMYLVVGNIPCNERATMSRRTATGGMFLYCDEHAGRVDGEMKRSGRTVALTRIVNFE